MTVVQPWSSKGLEITLHDLGLLSGPGVGPDVAPLSEVGHPRACRPSSPERGPGRNVAAWVRRGPGDDLVVALLSVGEGEPAVDLDKLVHLAEQRLQAGPVGVSFELGQLLLPRPRRREVDVGTSRSRRSAVA